MIQNYLEFKAVDNTVVGVLSSDMVARWGYTNEVNVVVCTCATIPGLSAEDVAQKIAWFLNTTNAETIKGMGFSLPYNDVAEHIRGAIDENHTD